MAAHLACLSVTAAKMDCLMAEMRVGMLANQKRKETLMVDSMELSSSKETLKDLTWAYLSLKVPHWDMSWDL